MFGIQSVKNALEGTSLMAGGRKARDAMRELSDYGQSVIPGISQNSRDFYNKLNVNVQEI